MLGLLGHYSALGVSATTSCVREIRVQTNILAWLPPCRHFCTHKPALTTTCAVLSQSLNVGEIKWVMALFRTKVCLFVCLFAGLVFASQLEKHGNPTTPFDSLSLDQLDEKLQVRP